MRNPIEHRLPFRKTSAGKAWEIATQKYHRFRRELYQRLNCRRSDTKRILLIVGCQRSGTTLMGNVLSKDLRTAVLQEQSRITGPDTLRLKPYDEVNQILHAFRAPFIIAKPLVETQRTPELLSAINGSRALWMFRHYQDVTRSNVKRFHSQIEGLRCAVSGEPRSWRNECISSETREIMARYFCENMRREDAAALGWYARNVLFFELELDARDDVMLCKYEDLVGDPDRVVERIYQFVGIAAPTYSITGDIDRQSLGLGLDVDIDDGIRELCEQLLSKIEQCYIAQQSTVARVEAPAVVTVS